MLLQAARNLPVPDTETCTGPIADAPVTTRETTAEGRGRIGPITVRLTALDGHHCDIFLDGRFHRAGTVMLGRLTILITAQRVPVTFRHRYCARFRATAVWNPPDNSFVLAVDEIEGRIGNCLLPDTVEEIEHGRLPTDGNDAVHHDTFVFP